MSSSEATIGAVGDLVLDRPFDPTLGSFFGGLRRLGLALPSTSFFEGDLDLTVAADLIFGRSAERLSDSTFTSVPDR